MGKVFVSYRHVEPDAQLAEQLERFLTSRGVAVFRDTQIRVGDEWPASIDESLRSSEFLVVLVSQASVNSRSVREEVRLAHSLGLRILPVRVDAGFELPYSLGTYLSERQALSVSDHGMPKICDQILEAVQDAAAHVQLAATPEEASDDLQPETGTVRLDSPYYIRRDVDARIESKLAGRRGQTILLRGPRQAGKSSLLVRAEARARTGGQQVTRIDFQFIDDEHRQTLSALLRYLAWTIASDFDTDLKPDQVWDDRFGAKKSLTKFIERAVLKNTPSPVVLCLDEVDSAFHTSYCEHFFGMLRAWHNERASNKLWNQFHLIISHATDPSLWIRDPNQSPFNVGERHLLTDFTVPEVTDLTRRYRVNVDVPKLMFLVGGHPFLVRRALYTLKNSSLTVDDLRTAALSHDGPFGDHLELLRNVVHQSGDLRLALHQILGDGRCESEKSFQQLQGVGLVNGDSRESAAVRCELYRLYFHKHL